MDIDHVCLLAAWHPIDTGVLVLFCLSLLLIGIYYRPLAQTNDDYFLAGRSIGLWPLGCSLSAAWVAGLTFFGLPATAYDAGVKSLWMPLAVWLVIALVIGVCMPIFQRLKLTTIYEYLELRFDATVSRWSSLLFLGWRTLWLVTALHLGCSWFAAGGDLGIPAWILVLAVGGLATSYTALGGLRAVVGTDLVKVGAILSGLGLLIGAVWLQLEGGAERVWVLMESFDRAEWVDAALRWDAAWDLGRFLPQTAVTCLLLYLTDQTIGQRFLAATSVQTGRIALLLHAGLITLLLPMLAYTGLALTAFFQDHPASVKPKWIVNVDPQTGLSRLNPATGKPWLDWREADRALRPERVLQLVAERRLIEPNRAEPYTDAAELFTDESQLRLDLARLAARKPPRGLARQGEMILHQQARPELLPWFVTTCLPWGVRGLVFTAVLSALLATIDAGLPALSSMLIAGWSGTGRLAGSRSLDSLSKSSAAGNRALRPPLRLVLLVGTLLTLVAAVAAALELNGALLIRLMGCWGGPLLGVFVLGLGSRRATARGALAALAGGSTLAAVCSLASLFSRAPGYLFNGSGYPEPDGLGGDGYGSWAVLLTFVSSLLLGWIVSLCGDRPKPKNELRGLVIGLQPLGDLKKITVGTGGK